MIAPDDPRHGSTRGWYAGCEEACCRAAKARYEKHTRYRVEAGIVWAIPAIGAQRRIRALMRMGWTSTDIADAAGYAHRNHIFRILKGQKGRPCTWLERKTHTTIAEVFEELAMQVPEITPWRGRTLALAAREGWPPPLAWDDIDDPDEKPAVHLWGAGDWQDQVDHAVVWRVVNEQARPRKLTRAESTEVTRILRSRGVSTFVIENDYGIKPDRYSTGAGDRPTKEVA